MTATPAVSAAFSASTVEAVEALSIVLLVGGRRIGRCRRFPRTR